MKVGVTSSILVVALTIVVLMVSLTGITKAQAEVVSINFTISNVNFGTGSVTVGKTNCTLNTQGTSNASGGCANFILDVDPFILENTGTEKVNVSLHVDKNAASLFGGTDPDFAYAVLENVVDGNVSTCENMGPGSLTDVNTTSPGTQICGGTNGLDAVDKNDSIEIHIQFIIPSDTTKSGAQTATITATATEIPD